MHAQDTPAHALRVSRRNFIQSSVAGIAAMTTGLSAAQPAASSGSGHAARAAGSSFAPAQSVVLRVNGKRHDMTLEPRVTLLDALREVMDLTGTKKGCDRGQCGACTVMIDGRRINSCLTLAIMHDGQEITTIEGLAQGDVLHPLQQAFLDHDAYQCGYCTPGQICSAAAMLNEAGKGAASAVTPDLQSSRIVLSDDEIRERMSGNICRCGAYPNIVAAIRFVAGSKA
jgi:xanthine dehydrogenase YagT iron-sulfur-binding subunit